MIALRYQRSSIAVRSAERKRWAELPTSAALTNESARLDVRHGATTAPAGSASNHTDFDALIACRIDARVFARTRPAPRARALHRARAAPYHGGPRQAGVCRRHTRLAG